MNTNKPTPANAAKVPPQNHGARMADQRAQALECVNKFEANGMSGENAVGRVRVVVASELMRIGIGMEDEMLKAFDHWPAPKDALCTIKRFRAVLHRLQRVRELAIDTIAGSKPGAEFAENGHAQSQGRPPGTPLQTAAG
jgi:hypothetical protein